MNNVYYFETIKECEEQIIDKAIILDLVCASNMNLFDCFVRTVRTVMIWTMIISTIVLWCMKGFGLGVQVFLFLICIYIIGAILMSWVKFNFNRSYTNIKINLVDGMVKKCKEYQESNHEDWEEKQMIKRFGDLAGINIDLDNAK